MLAHAPILPPAILSLSLFIPAPNSPNPVTVERETYVMGTSLRAAVSAPTKADGVAALEAAFAEIRRLDALLSTWRGDSELSRLNRAEPGMPVSVASPLLALLRETWAWRGPTDGAFDPAIGALIDAWDLQGGGRAPAERELDAALRASGPGTFSIDAESGMITRVVAGAWIDAGAFGKGAALRAARAALREAGVSRGLVDFGGQFLALGPEPGASHWVIHVAHPQERDRPVAELRVRDVSVATSGASERFVEVEGRRYGHVLDPRTGLPVPAWGSVTVVADDPLIADILSTALFVLGPKAAVTWAAEREDVGVLFLEAGRTGLRAWWNAELGRWLTDGRVGGAVGAEASLDGEEEEE